MLSMWQEKWCLVYCVLFANLAGCANMLPGGYSVTWEKAGTSSDQMRVDYGLCGGNFDLFGMPNFKPQEFEAINRCMQRNGYILVER